MKQKAKIISVEQAKRLLMQNISEMQPALTSIENTFGSVLSENVFSKIDLPLFAQSAMDGYGIADATEGTFDFRLIGEIKAGIAPRFKVGKGETIRIFTGAAVPKSVKRVIPQENAKEIDDKMFLEIKGNSNIRSKGSQIKKGEIALKKGMVLNPAAIALLASMGNRAVNVYKKPVVSILVTGNELQEANGGLATGKIYESNSVMLSTALLQLNIHKRTVAKVRDNKNDLKNELNHLLEISDVVLVSGGISVGKYDLVKEAMEALGVKEIFYKVAQKPGKPLFFGKKNTKAIFALPGNPAASLTCFYEYVFPAIKKMMGYEECFLPKTKLPIAKEFSVNKERANFLKGKIINDKVTVLGGQESFMLKSFAVADCMIFIPAGKNKILKGEKVEVHLLPKN